ncbi:MAG: biopolymer transporter ExbD [Candidatus Accumulibacter sp.]|jgi:biopolymer transport protein ExbD|nr:biopolymer transporter ExbD [Accumulibacter sp.]
MEDNSFDSLNMVPFIDIMLVLLTIVLTTSSFIASGRVPVKLPQATASPAERQETEIVEIAASGQVYYAGEAVSLDALAAKLAGLDRTSPILLRADKTLQLQLFVDVAELLKREKFSRVAIQTEVIGR